MLQSGERIGRALLWALFLTAVATGGTKLLSPVSANAPFGAYYIAVAVAGRFGGNLAGLFTIPLALLLGDYFVLSANDRLVLGTDSLTAQAMFVMVSAIVLSVIFDLRSQEAKTRASERKLSSILDAAISAVITIDRRQSIISMNPAAETMLRCSQSEAIGKPIEDFIAEDHRVASRRCFKRLSRADLGRQAAKSTAIRGRRLTGEEFPAEISITILEADADSFVTLIVRDISEHVSRERELARLSRLYEALSEINQAIVQSRDRTDLFNRACRSLVKSGGFRMAWIGWHDVAAQRLVPIADFGDSDNYLSNVEISTEDELYGRGPTGTAFREGHTCICEDMLSDPNLRPWREALQRRQLRSSAAFPLRLGGVIEGVLTVYAHEAAFFRDKEIALLEEAASDISFALDNFSREYERQKAQAYAQRENEFSSAMIESMPGIVYFYDSNGRFLRWNRNFETLSGYSGDEIREMHPLQFFRAAERELVGSRIEDVFAKGEASVEATFLAKDGSVAPYFFTGRHMVFDSRPCLVGVGIDISQRKVAEDALRELNESLESKVADRTEQLRSALVRAESADRTKSAFLATMSHELRTPLNSIIGFTGIVLKGLAGPLLPEQTKQLGMVRNSARHLLDLINDVLDISKIEAGELQIRPKSFDLRESVDRVVNSVRPQAAAKSLSLDVIYSRSDDTIVSDQRRVEQTLLNLLNNAIKFTDRGGVTLRVDETTPGANAAVSERATVRLQVADSGIGIRPEDIEQLFKPFRQIDTGLSRRHEGTGLGLAICRRLVELLGGTISVESELGRGSVFTVTLPMKGSV